MNNTFSVNYMTKTCNSFLKMNEMIHVAEKNKGFNRELVEKYESIKETSGISEINTVSTQDMTMEEYKQYIHDKISQIPLHPSQSGWLWNIEITDEGFEAMKNNPEYEEYVLRTIRSNFSFQDPWHNKNYSVLHFGATKEESYGKSWGMGSPCMKKSEDTFWERRLEKKKKMQKQIKKYMEKRKMQELETQENAIQRKLDYERIENMNREPEADETWIRQKKVAKAAKAAAFYETNIIVGNSGTN